MALIITLKAVPGSGRQAFMLSRFGELKCYLKSQPERGLANKELITLLSKSLNIPQSHITLIGGDTSRKKKIALEGVQTLDEVLVILGLKHPEKQEQLFV